MSCLKCGRDTQDEQVFCSQCLAVMEQYPVKPGIAIQLPRRPEPTAHRPQPKRRTPPPEEIIRIQRHRLRLLFTALVLALILVGLLAVPAYRSFTGERYLPGQNYKTVTVTTPSSEPTEPSGTPGA